MKRTIIIITAAVLIIAAITFATVKLYKDNSGNADKTNSDLSEAIQTDIVLYPVCRGDIANVFNVTATAYAGKEAIKEINIQKTEGGTLQYIRGDNVEKGVPLYSGGENEVISEYRLKILDINEEEVVYILKVLDYSEIKLAAQVPYAKYNYVRYNTECSAYVRNKTNVCVIEDIGYEIQNGYFEVIFSCDAYILPGLTLNIAIKEGIIKDALFTDADAVYTDGTSYYVNVRQKDNSTVKTEVTVGQTFSEESGGYIYYNIVITGGVKDGDMLVRYNVTTDAGDKTESDFIYG